MEEFQSSYLGHKIYYGECNTLVLTPFALNIYDVNIVINHGVELKEKSPPLI